MNLHVQVVKLGHINGLLLEGSHEALLVELASVELEAFYFFHYMSGHSIPQLLAYFLLVLEGLDFVGELRFLVVLGARQQQNLKRHLLIV